MSVKFFHSLLLVAMAIVVVVVVVSGGVFLVCLELGRLSMCLQHLGKWLQ